MKKSKVLLMIAAYNEEENLESVIDNLIDNYPQYDYVVINDGSRDNTAAICKKRKYNFINVPINLGIGGAIQTGYRYAREYGYDIAVQLDGDGQHDPAYLDDVIEPILDGDADYVIGSRFIHKEGFQSSFTRRIGIKFLSGLITVLTFRHIKDVTSGFRAVNKFLINVYADNYPIDYPEPEAIVDAVMRRQKIMEVPVVMREREKGTSSINLKRSFYYMIKVTLDIIVCRISYGVRR
ncbi:MAG: glycosyltransferase family 2 protein [Butyrivibrio sp.]|nr:glycosyltransferase family 2 protein [Butyrivibrio sp.]